MRTYTYHPLILLVIILSTVSCENELPFNIKDNPPKLVMNAFYNADSLTNVLFLNLTGKDNSTHIENATVEVLRQRTNQRDPASSPSGNRL